MIIKVRYSLFKRLLFLFVGKMEIQIPLKSETFIPAYKTECPPGIDIELISEDNPQ